MSAFSENDDMHVIKRGGNAEIISFDKILQRIKKLGKEADIKLNYTALVMKVIDQLYDGISTTKLDELSAEQCASMASIHPDYNTLAGRIVVSNHHKNTSASFSEVVSRLYNHKDNAGKSAPIISADFYKNVMQNAVELDQLCDYSRDYLIDFFGFKTLERSYLMKINKITAERPQHMWMRVAVGIHGLDMERVKETYYYLSNKYFTHATPTLFNCGTPRPQCSSCFLLAMESDSLEGIYDTLKDCARISKWSGGIGLHIHNVRATGSQIRGTNGVSTGIVPMLRVFNNTAKYIDQGSKRNGSFAIYLEPWHADIEMFLQMRKNHGDEELKARDLFYALWIPDLFMERIKTGGKWTLMCPDECPGLPDVWGEDFNTLYQKYENAGKGRITMNARDLWFKIMDAQMETGTPYLLYKDAANRKSNQKNVGTIKSSNLCVSPETMILTDKGPIEIQKLTGKHVNVWNGHEFSEVEVMKTGENEELMHVYTDDGCVLRCTPFHKFFIQTDVNTVEIVDARNLKSGDVLPECEYPVIDNQVQLPNAYLYGEFCGENTYTSTSFSDAQYYIPFKYSLNTKLEWFSGYCYSNRAKVENNTLNMITMNNEFLLHIKWMLQTCGINPIICMEDLVDHYRLSVGPHDLHKLCSLGFSLRNTPIQITDLDKEPKRPVKITGIYSNQYTDDTYCFTEPKRHAGIFNGMLTSQCSEIIQYSDKNETAVCNLASIALPAFIDTKTDPPTFDFEKLHDIARIVTYNLNRIIDINYYPTEKTRLSNMRHRPIGIGVQGLADVFIMMNMPFISEQAKQLNRDIFETIYHGALTASCNLAKQDCPYETFSGSPASKGILQFDMWTNSAESNRYKWSVLKEDIMHNGLRNSLLIAPMPTASTSQILGYNECVEPITSNIYSRRTLAGEFIVANKYLLKELIDLDLWSEKMKNNIIANNGSIQHIETIPAFIREKYKTVWELPMKGLIDMAADRGAFICQSQSLNLWLEDPNYNSLTSMHFYAWSKGLKTGIYYLRRRGKAQAQQFTIEPEKKNNMNNNEDNICEMCSS